MKKMIFILLVFFSVSGYSQDMLSQSEAGEVIQKLSHEKLPIQGLSSPGVNATESDARLADRFILKSLFKTNKTRKLTAADIDKAVNSQFLNQNTSLTEEQRNQLIAEYVQYFSK